MNRIRVIYKSGAIVDCVCEDFAVTKDALGELRKVEWTDAKPRAMFLGLDDVAAIWDLGPVDEDGKPGACEPEAVSPTGAAE